MKRRTFFKLGTQGVVAAGLTPIAGRKAKKSDELGDRENDQWMHLGEGAMMIPERKKTLTYDVAVAGGGMAGISAAVSAARNGAKVVLIQDRPVLGGNGSSEIRVHVNGVNHQKTTGMAQRETGIIEEILLANRFYNPQEAFTVWDHVIYDYVTLEPNLDLMMNTQAVQALMDGSRIKSAICWQLTTETLYTVNADIFIDCSGDGLLAASAGALYRTGREASTEFDEKYAPALADGWQMGSTLLIKTKDMGKPMPYEAPAHTIKYDPSGAHPKRKIKTWETGIWWIEVGSDDDIIGEQEDIRQRLMGHVHGVWDYIKNSGKFPHAENHALIWIGSLPGRRESRRFIGDHIFSEKDILENRHFEDAVAYGGWSLDEHNPGGIENLKEPPSYFHAKTAEVYEIPYRSLYSENISNLLFAGRNISQTHIALSSSRVQATCATMGQAVGTAASICVRKKILPRDVANEHVNELQEQLLRDDAFIPNRPARDEKDRAREASTVFASSTSSGNASLLTDGMSRDFKGKEHHWASDGLPAMVQLEWETPVVISSLEIKCDTNVLRNIMMRHDSKVSKSFINSVPEELLKTLEAEVRVKGKWKRIGEIDNNKRRLIKFGFGPDKVSAVRIRLKETYGAENAKLFEVRCY